MRGRSIRSGLLIVMVAGAVACRSGSEPERKRATTDAPLKVSGQGAAALNALSWPQRIGLEQAMAARDPRHAPRIEHGIATLGSGPMIGHFTARGARLALGAHEVSLAAARIGRDGGARRVLGPDARFAITGPEVRTDRGGGVREWWRSLPSGLEHGLTLAERPAGSGELEIEVEAGGNLAARALSSDAIALVSAGGVRVATYARLLVLDADGARVPARMAVRDGRIALVLDDAGARYPIVVDPIVAVEEATLIPSGGGLIDDFGTSVALSADGTRALVGSPTDDRDSSGVTDTGSARVYLRTGSTWTEEAMLVASGAAAGDRFGIAVALSSDGSRALVGAFMDDTPVETGSVRVFLRTGTAWAEEATLVPNGGAQGDNFGWSVAISADGSRAVVGAPLDDTAGGANAGSAQVFLRTGTTWNFESALLAPDGAANDNLGWSVAISSDGSRAVAGAPLDDIAGATDAGSARVFLRTGTTWAQELSLFASDRAMGDNLGWSVAVSSDASRVLVGAYLDDTLAFGVDTGSARVFLRSGAVWSEEATLVGTTGLAANDNFGWSVAISSDGSRALVGAPRDDTPAGGIDAGSARVFLRTGSTWAEETSLLHADAAPNDTFGIAVALSSDGGQALVGVPRDVYGGVPRAGSARALVRNGTTWTDEATLVASGGGSYDYFAWSVSLSADGSRALVGTINTPGPGASNGSGSARIFLRTGTTWTEEAILLATPTRGDSDRFGCSVSLSADGSRALVGSSGAGSVPGNARVFARTGTTWTAEATLVPPDPTSGEQFGSAVALSGDGIRAIVGSPNYSLGSVSQQGRVKIFLRTGTTWAQETSLFAANYNAGDQFGSAVALSSDGSRALVGAPTDDTTGGTDAGSVRVLLRTGTTWAEETALFAAGGAMSDRFGSAVALSSDGDRALVGAPYDVTFPVGDTGSARVFLRTGTTWAEEATLLGSNGGLTDRFGTSVALSGDGSKALVGVPFGDPAAGADAGSARLFVRTGATWAEGAIVLSAAGLAGDRFGHSVALSSDGSRALVGVPYGDTVGGVDTGHARVYTFQTSSDPNGTACTTGGSCASGFCVDGVCCNAACGGSVATDCQACSAAAGASVNGTCTTLSGTSCDDGNACTHTDVCSTGACSGTAITCTSDQCNTRACNGSATCAVTPRTGVACDDGQACTYGETCSGSGVCGGGTTITCTSDQCNTRACNGSASCTVTALTGTACNDSNACTYGDTCSNAGACAGTAITCTSDQCNTRACNGTATCTVAPLTGMACNDGNVCTYGEMCDSNGACGGGSTITCASDQCNTRACNGTATCTITPLTGTACNDNNACTQTDTCQAGACTGSNPIACGGADACHDAVCNPSTGTCSNPNKANGTPCGTGCAATCQAGACTAGGSVTCSPLDQCHAAGVCNPTTGVCSNPPVANGTACNDGNPCTQNDSCQTGACTGTAVVCAATDACHVAGTCNVSTGACSNPPAADDTPCTGGLCQAGTCVQPDGGANDGGTGTGGTGGTGGSAGGAGGTGGAAGSAGTGGVAGTGGGASGTGGTGGGAGTGGTTGAGGAAGSGGAGGAGGSAGTTGGGGASGATGTGGGAGTGGAGTGGVSGAGGAGGAAGTGGTAVSGDAGTSGGAGTGGTTGGRDGGSDARNTNPASNGCGCGVSSGGPRSAVWLLPVALLIARRSRRRRPAP